MEPFAYQKPRKSNSGKFILVLLAGVSFSAWHFDLIPQLAPVDTGRLDTDEAVSEADFLSMLDSPLDPTNAAAPDTTRIVDHKQPELASDEVGNDSLLAALATQTEPIENSFPEFARAKPASKSVTEEAAPARLPGLPVKRPTTGITQTAFERAESSNIVHAIDQSIAPVVLDSATAETLRNVDAQTLAGETLKAHGTLSNLYWKTPNLRAMIQQRIEETSAEIYANPHAHFAEPYVVQFGDTLEGIAKNYNVPGQYLARLNAVSPATLQAGQSLKVLKGPFAAVVDLDQFQMTIHAHGWFVRKYTIGIGKDRKTPVGEFTIQDKLENPTWYNPQGGKVDGDDPENPLGEYWLGLGDHIGIHGTIDPTSIGKAASRGCIHLADDNIAEVYQLLGVGSPVRIRH